MKKLAIAIVLIGSFVFCVFAEKNGADKKPPFDQTQSQIDKRTADVKKRTGKSMDFNKIGQPVADPQRRRHVLCRVLGPEEWGLVFPDVPSDYGGTVCVRK